jgi:hydrogenase maturation factor
VNGAEVALVVVGEIAAVEHTEDGRVGVVSVRGARVRVALDLVPGARVGDAVLANAGVALASWRDGRGEDAPCA